MNRYSYCIDNNNKLQRFQVKNKSNNSKLNKDINIDNQDQNYQDEFKKKIKKNKSSNYNERAIFQLNNLKEKKEINELGSNNKFLSKTKRIINNPIKENEAKLANLPLNYNYSSDSTNDLNQSKNKEI